MLRTKFNRFLLLMVIYAIVFNVYMYTLYFWKINVDYLSWTTLAAGMISILSYIYLVFSDSNKKRDIMKTCLFNITLWSISYYLIHGFFYFLKQENYQIFDWISIIGTFTSCIIYYWFIFSIKTMKSDLDNFENRLN